MTEKKKVKKQPDPDIEYRGTSITLPNDPTKMAIDDAIEALERKKADEETKLDVHEVIEHHPHDALVAMYYAMKDTYGWVSPQTIKTFFGDIAPDMVKVPTGPKDHEFMQVPCGRFKLPNVSEPINLHMDFERNVLHIVGQVRKRDQHYIVDLANKARAYLKENSIFRGKAIRLKVDDDGDPIFADVRFIETDYIKPEQLILNPDELEQVKASIWTPIQHTDRCVQYGIPLNRGVLLEGTYGTGKTMSANVTSKVCVDNGWTYILLDDVRALKETLLFAQRYQPCVIFAEDIDRVAEDRDQLGNDILNTIDGILTKNSQVITVLTTNHVEKLDRAMLRPGRLDAVIGVKPPQEEAVKRLCRLYAGELLDPDDALEGTAEELAGNIPATIREVVERSKLSMIARDGDHINDADLVTSAKGMAAHLALLNTEKPKKTAAERAGMALQELLLDEGAREEFHERMNGAVTQVRHAAGVVQRSSGQVSQSIAQASEVLGDKLDDVHEDTGYIKKRV